MSACRVCPVWWNSPYDDVELLKICFRVVERICDHLEEIDIVRFGTNNLLECITDK